MHRACPAPALPSSQRVADRTATRAQLHLPLSRAPVPHPASMPTPPVPAPHLQKVSVALQCPSSGSLHVLSSWITIWYPILSSLGQNRLELYSLRVQRSLIGHYILYPFILLVRMLGASAATRLTQGHTFHLLMTAWINDYLWNFLLCQ